jgi:hypothetical protein
LGYIIDDLIFCQNGLKTEICSSLHPPYSPDHRSHLTDLGSLKKHYVDIDFQAMKKVVYIWLQEQRKTCFSGGIKTFID